MEKEVENPFYLNSWGGSNSDYVAGGLFTKLQRFDSELLQIVNVWFFQKNECNTNRPRQYKIAFHKGYFWCHLKVFYIFADKLICRMD